MRKAFLAIAPLALFLAACGGTGGGTGNPGAGNLGEHAGLAGTVATIILKDFSLTPATLKIPKPGTYTFVAHNEGAQQHSLAVTGPGLNAKGTTIGFGSKMSFKVTFTKAGTYSMFCPVDGHKALGMTGSVVVG
jgi:plastocyanin